MYVAARQLARPDGDVGILSLERIQGPIQLLRLLAQVGIHGNDDIGVLRYRIEAN
jgi:hypothetical protein